ncbi:nucleolar transcription factor 1-A-like [Pseudophryne corroboree]|uniref:nucleolar transcription factor 1-A-like n=1 Tax=Pseudophryne corroboree TaxID=495146 RepID=UPI0030815983
MTAPSKQDPWSQEDMLTLIESMKTSLPAKDTSKYTVTASRLDWNKLAFKNYTGSMCQEKWTEISNKTRKFRTLTEIILDTEEYVKNWSQKKKVKKGPPVSKKPLSPYLRFFVEHKAQYEKKHPEMSHIDLSRTLSQKYKELSEEEKMKYIEDFQREMQEYECNVGKIREEPVAEELVAEESGKEDDAATVKRKRHRFRKRKNYTPATTVKGYIYNKITLCEESP